jgi:hypothetical protein
MARKWNYYMWISSPTEIFLECEQRTPSRCIFLLFPLSDSWRHCRLYIWNSVPLRHWINYTFIGTSQCDIQVKVQENQQSVTTIFSSILLHIILQRVSTFIRIHYHAYIDQLHKNAYLQHNIFSVLFFQVIEISVWQCCLIVRVVTRIKTIK